MPLSTQLINLFFSHRLSEIEYFMEHAAQVQRQQLEKLITVAANTAFGKEHNYRAIHSYDDFVHHVPVTTYEDYSHYIDRERMGENSVVWSTPIRWFAKSSGTTGSKSKFIPVSSEGLKDCHLRGPMDVVSIYAWLNPKTQVFTGKTLTLGGSHRIESLGADAQTGDLSAILIENTPRWAGWRRVPKTSTALIADFEQKVEQIYKETVDQNVTSFAGVPSWNLVMFNKILELSGKNNMLEIWENLELFVHGGMNFKPYRDQFHKIIPSDGMHYMETYNASEGFFAIQNDPMSDDMLLMLDYGIFYEFLPMSDFGDMSKAVPLEGVREGVNYAMIISSSNGLWRYMIGDTVEFTSILPYKIKITGRTKHFINAFGEEIIIDNAETALRIACDRTGAAISDYTAAPIFMDSSQESSKKGSHQWVVEFSQLPSDLDLFIDVLDSELQKVNSDYEAKRFKDTTLFRPTVTPLNHGAFYQWLKSQGKTGGQNKVPRLFNDRTYVDQLLKLNDTI